MNGFREDAERVKQGAEQARAVYRSFQQPSRAEQRGVSGPTIGAAPTTPGGTRSGGTQGSRGRSASYEATLRRKQRPDERKARQRAETSRPRSQGYLGTPTPRIPGGPRPGVNGGNGGAGPSLAGMPWMDSPLYWVGIGAIAFLLLRKRKK